MTPWERLQQVAEQEDGERHVALSPAERQHFQEERTT